MPELRTIEGRIAVIDRQIDMIRVQKKLNKKLTPEEKVAKKTLENIQLQLQDKKDRLISMREPALAYAHHTRQRQHKKYIETGYIPTD